MPPTKYGKYVTREIIKQSKYPQINTPMARYNGCRGGDALQDCEWSCITKPFTMDDEPEIDKERDQFLLFSPGNIEDPKSFDAEIEYSIGSKGKKLLSMSQHSSIYRKEQSTAWLTLKKLKNRSPSSAIFFLRNFPPHGWLPTNLNM